MTATSPTPNGAPAADTWTPKPFQMSKSFSSNTSNFKFIESTLREGEQFSNAFFDTGEIQFLILQPTQDVTFSSLKTNATRIETKIKMYVQL
jgi:hypothetical protein